MAHSHHDYKSKLIAMLVYSFENLLCYIGFRESYLFRELNRSTIPLVSGLIIMNDLSEHNSMYTIQERF